MENRYIVFDVETPNSANSRMSAIGITVVENGMIVDELSTLVNPETWFHAFNIRLTGMKPRPTSGSSGLPWSPSCPAACW